MSGDGENSQKIDSEEMIEGAGSPPEFSRVIDINKVGAEGRRYELTPDENTRRQIAKRLDIEGVASLSGVINVAASRNEITITGVLHADLLRECVASLETMKEKIEEEIDIAFLRRAPAQKDSEEGEAAEWELPEVHESDELDLGEFLVQQLSLAMDPFPRKDGATSLAEEYGQIGSSSPFAGLQESLEKEQKKQ